MKRNFFMVSALLVVASSLSACIGLMYSAEPMQASIVDAETKQPLEGVIVVAHWQLEHGTVGGSVPAGQLMVMEAVTDKDGKFAFPGFAPKFAVTSHLVHKDPELILFKSGYYYQALTNEYSSDIELRTRLVRRSDWNGKTIEMERFKGAMAEKDILRDFENLNSSVESFVRNAEECNWKKIPKMILGIRKQRAFLTEKGITGTPFGISSVDQYLLDNSEKFAREGGTACGSPKNLFGSDKP